ncbi:MAG: LamG domain-containing protein [Candidatus Omnitrophica bacterium]|nr:LamG domain-containing protein [Candidatus Omnitrophota bacterium]
MIGTLALLALPLLCFGPGSPAGTELNTDPALKGWWKLAGDARDSSSHGNHGVAHGVIYDGTFSAEFDGRKSCVEIPDSDSLDLATGDFTVSAWIRTDEEMDDIIGDVLSKYDPETRKGFSLGLLDNAGVAAGQSNRRHLFFGTDWGQDNLEWIDRGRPGEAVFVMALTVYEGALYAGTYESGEGKTGRVYRFEGPDRWIDCGAPDPSNSISAMAVHKGQLYAAASHYRAGGSSLDASENTTPGGRIYRYLGGKDWELCGELEGHEAILGLIDFRGNLYASSLYHPAGLYRYQGGTEWENCGNPNSRCVVLGVWNGQLLSGGYDGDKGGVARYNGGRDWTYLGTPPGVTQTYSFASHFGELFVGTWPEGKVFRYGGPESWVDAGRLGDEKEVMGLMVYNGKLYGGTLPLAKVFRYEEEGSWTDTGQLDKTPDVKYRRAWTMAIHDGQLFCGTLPSGHVHSLEVGQCVTYDHALPRGWRHVAAVRNGKKVLLYIDGKPVAEKRSSVDSPKDLSNDSRLRIGFGPQDFFKGALREVRVYSRPLSESEIESLSSL